MLQKNYTDDFQLKFHFFHYFFAYLFECPAHRTKNGDIHPFGPPGGGPGPWKWSISYSHVPTYKWAHGIRDLIPQPRVLPLTADLSALQQAGAENAKETTYEANLHYPFLPRRPLSPRPPLQSID